MTDFPRLLVATEFPPNGAGGGAAIVRQMLKDWPVEKLFWWSCHPDRDELFGQKTASHRVAQIPAKLNPNRRGRALKSWLMDKFWVPRATDHFQNTLETSKPEVVWAIPHGWSIPPMVRVLPQAGIGFHVSIHDYADIQPAIIRFGAPRAAEMAAMADRLYASATTRDAICQPMVDDLRARTKCEGSINHAGLEQEDFDYLATIPAPATHNVPIRIAYAGTIIAEQTFRLFVKALDRIRSKVPLTLEFFGDHSYRSCDWFDAGWMKERGNLNAQSLAKELKEYDWGFAPMELTDENPRYNRFSLPTKLISYLAAGLQVIAAGHPESSMIKTMSPCHAGLCITDSDAGKVEAQLLAGLSKPDAKAQYRAAIQRCALAEFDVRRMRAVLHGNFQRCASVP
jgi:hypothetical protein